MLGLALWVSGSLSGSNGGEKDEGIDRGPGVATREETIHIRTYQQPAAGAQTKGN